MSNNKHNFQKLTPIKDVDLKIYDDALNFVFENNDIRNVAVSGPYSAGKSSIIETYKEKHKDKKFLHISLAHFEPMEQKKPVKDESALETKEPTSPKSRSEDILEGQILNQLIHKIEPERIPLTQFKTKKATPNNKIKWITALLSVFFLSSAYNLFYKRWNDFVAGISNNDIKYLMKFTTGKALLLLSGLICTIILIIGLYNLLKTQYDRNILKKISFQGNEIEIFEKNDESYFDKYLNEVLYLFRNSGAEVIVFEDMDRYNINQIFGKLREINKLINEKQNKPIRFFYLLKDDIFVSKDRTKFFDYIIPVVPVIDGSNSYEKFIEHFEKGGIYKLFDESFLQGLSLYIDDMRILKNIYNEFVIYYDRIQSTELSNNKLLAMITYKNIFPRDFNDLQLGMGYVHTLFDKKPNVIENKIRDINSDIQILTKRVEEIENETLNEIAELDTVFLKLDSNSYYVNGKTDSQFKTRAEFMKEMRKYQQSVSYYNRSSYGDTDMSNTFENLLKNPEYAKRKGIIESKNNGSIDKYKSELGSLKNQKLLIQSSKLKDLIDKHNADEVFSVSFENEIGQVNNFEDIKASPYFALIKYLIWHGHIDETYADYMTYFYGNSISAGDKIFLRSVTDQIPKEYTYSLKNPQLVLSRLRVADFKQIETLNFDLLVYILTTRKDNIEYLKQLIIQLRDLKNYSFVGQFLDTRRAIDLFVESLNHLWTTFFYSIPNESQYSEMQMKQYAIDTLYYSPAEDIEILNTQNCMTNFISDSADFLNIDAPLTDKLIDGFKLTNVVFKALNYTDANKDLFTAVYKNDLYELNFDLITLMLEVMYELPVSDNFRNSNYTLVMSKQDEPLCVYVNRFINNYISIILDNCDECITDNETSAISILNNTDIDVSYKKTYIDYLHTEIVDIQSIDKPALWELLMHKRKAKYSTANILSYFFLYAEELDDILTQFINNYIGDLYFDIDAINRLYGEGASTRFTEAVITCSETNASKYEMILASLKPCYDNFPFTDIEDSKLFILIKLDVIRMTSENLTVMRDNYPEQLISFIKKDIELYSNEIITKENFVFSEMLEVLDLDISEDYKIKLLQLAEESISVQHKNYSDTVIRYILEHNLDEGDIPYLLKTYPDKPNTIKAVIENIAAENISIILDEQFFIPFELLYELFVKDELSISEERDLLVFYLPNMDEYQAKKCFQALKMNDYIRLLERKRPTFEINDINRKLLKIFADKYWITRFEVDKDDPSYYRAYGRDLLRKMPVELL